MKAYELDIDNLVKRYTIGESEKALAESFSVSRSAIRKRLLDAGIKPRNRSEAMYVRMDRATDADRAALTAACHSDEVLIQSALKRGKTKCAVGRGEDLLDTMLRSRGFKPKTQFPVDRYNIDLAISPVAVELSTNATNPLFDPRLQRRIVKLADLGWSTFYVWVDRVTVNLTKSAVDEAVTFIEHIRSLPAGVCEYGMVRGDGTFLTSGKPKFDHWPYV